MKGGVRWERGGRGEGNAADERRGASENEEVCDCSETRDAWRDEVLLRPSCQHVWLLRTSAVLFCAVLLCCLLFSAVLSGSLLFSFQFSFILSTSPLVFKDLCCSPLFCSPLLSAVLLQFSSILPWSPLFPWSKPLSRLSNAIRRGC